MTRLNVIVDRPSAHLGRSRATSVRIVNHNGVVRSPPESISFFYDTPHHLKTPCVQPFICFLLCRDITSCPPSPCSILPERRPIKTLQVETVLRTRVTTVVISVSTDTLCNAITAVSSTHLVQRAATDAPVGFTTLIKTPLLRTGKLHIGCENCSA